MFFSGRHQNPLESYIKPVNPALFGKPERLAVNNIRLLRSAAPKGSIQNFTFRARKIA